MPLFSIVMPTFNQKYFISKAIRSVIDQDWRDWEMIIVDNYSQDGTAEAVEAFIDDRIKYFKFSNNGIIAAARNYGIKQSGGEFIAFLDSDDYWHKGKLSSIKRLIEQQPQIDFICHDEYWEYEGGKRRKVRYGPWSSYRDILIKGNSFSTSANVVRRSKLFDVGIFNEDPRFIGAEDYDLWLRLSLCCNVFFLHEILGAYVIHAGASSNGIERHAQGVLNVIEYHFVNNLSGEKLSKFVCRKRKAEVLRQCARDLLRRKNHKLSKHYLIKSLSENPVSLKAAYLFVKLFLISSLSADKGEDRNI